MFVDKIFDSIFFNDENEQDSGCFRYGTDWRPSYPTIGRTLLHNGLLASLRTSKGSPSCITIYPATESDIAQFLKPVSDECDFDALRSSVMEKANSQLSMLAMLSISEDIEDDQPSNIDPE